MKKTKNAEAGSKRPVWLKIAIALCGAYLLYVILGFLAAPSVVRSVFQGTLAESMQREISLEKAFFNPFTLSLELSGLVVDDDKGEPFVEIGRLFANPQVFPLVAGRISVKEFALSDSTFRVQIDAGGELNFSRLLEAPVAEESEPADPMHFEVGTIEVENVRLELADFTRSLPLEESIRPISFAAQNLKSDFDHRAPFQFEASMGEDASVEWTGGVFVNPIKSHGEFSIQELDISKAKPFWHDLIRADIDGRFSFSGSYEFAVDESGERAALKNGSARLKSFHFSDPDEDTEASVQELAVEGIEASWPDNRVEIGSIALIAPSAHVVRKEDGSLALPLKAEAQGEATQASNPAPSPDEVKASVSALVKRFSLESGTIDLIDRTLPQADPLGMREINILATDIAPFDESLNARLELNTTLSGGGSIRWEGEANLPRKEITGTLEVGDLELPPFQDYVSQYANALIESGKLNLDVEYEFADSSQGIRLDSNFDVSDLDIRDSSNSEPILAFAKLQVSQARYENEAVNIASVLLENPIATVALEESGLNLSRLAKADPEEAKAEGAVGGEVEAADPLPVPLRLERFTMTGGKVDMIDRTLEPAHQSSMVDVFVELGNLSSSESDSASVSFLGAFDRGGVIRIEGSLLPLDFKNESDLVLGLNDFDLTLTAPYWEKYLGRGLNKGTLRVDAQFGIKQSELSGSNGIFIDQLTLGEKVASEDSLGLPIGLAVAILKDRAGRMEFPPIKLSGNLDDPSVSISGIVMKAMGNVIVKIATSPFAVLGGIAGLGGQADLSKAPFEQGKFAIEGEVETRLGRLAKILIERPGLKLKVSSVIAETPERIRFQRARIASRAMAISGGGAEPQDPIALLQAFDESAYRAKAESVYRELMGLTVEAEPQDAAAIASEDPPDELEGESVSVETESRKGLWTRLAGFLRMVTGRKAPPRDASSEEAEANAETAEAGAELAAEEVAVPEMALPPFEEIEAALLARDEFQAQSPWFVRLAQERLDRVKNHLSTTHGIEASRIILSGEATTDASMEISLVQFELTD